MFPGLANAYVKPAALRRTTTTAGSCINGLSDEDNLNLMDRQRISGTNKCYTVTGCNTFYPFSRPPVFLRGPTPVTPITTPERFLLCGALSKRLCVRLQLHLVALDRQFVGRRIGASTTAVRWCRMPSIRMPSAGARTSICGITSPRTRSTNCLSARTECSGEER